ncbi:MAG TPA: hypothetical protein PKZ97_12715 [Azospirillaceae bacterium]|nr:hypothetical protein [Azospirillaceae bacterium]
MALGRYDYERRYRRKIWSGFVKVALAAGVVLTAALFSYQMGVEQLKGRDAALREEVSALSMRNAELELLAQQMKTAARTAESHAREMEGRLAREVPTGERAHILELVTKRLAAGVQADRLAFVIEHAENPRNCKGVENKRFVVATPLLKPNARGAVFAGGAISITGEGVSARNAQRDPESWYDPGQPVTLKVTLMNGKSETVEGLLPLHHNVVSEGVEYRLVLSAGARSYIDVALDRCPFP